MKFNYQDFSLMQHSAWNAFESTLRMWKLSDEQIDKFTSILDGKDGFKAVDDALSEVVEWEDE